MGGVVAVVVVVLVAVVGRAGGGVGPGYISRYPLSHRSPFNLFHKKNRKQKSVLRLHGNLGFTSPFSDGNLTLQPDWTVVIVTSLEEELTELSPFIWPHSGSL